MKALKSLNHPNIIKLHGFLESSNNYYLVLEYCDEGDLHSYLYNGNNLLPENKIISIITQLASALHYLHNNKIIHRDIKLANIFMHKGKPLLGDFGFAKAGWEMAQTKLGTLGNMAPEVRFNAQQGYDYKSDLWSLGVVFYELLFGTNPFISKIQTFEDYQTVLNSIFDSKLDREIGIRKVSTDSINILKRLLEPNVAKRIDWEEFYRSPLFKDKISSPQYSLLPESSAEPIPVESPGLSHEEFDSPYLNILINKRSRTPSRNAIANTDIQREVKLIPADEAVQARNKREIQYRYQHELNLAMYICMTIKRLRSLTKQGHHNESLYLLMLVLAQKAISILTSSLESLQTGENIFGLPDMETYLRDKPEVELLIDQFKKDLQQTDNYYRYLISLKSNYSLSQPSEQLYSKLIVPISLKQANELILFLLNQTLGVDLPKEEEQARQYSLTLYHALHCARSTTLLPYKSAEGSKLDWPNILLKSDSLPLEAALSFIQANCRQ